MINIRKVFFSTLGCSKNDVDTASMESILIRDNYKIVNNPDSADIIVINTCGFIESAKEESIGEILEMTKYKEDTDKKLLVSGCLSERYPKELLEEIPEIDGIIGTGQIKDISEYIRMLEKDRFYFTGTLDNEHVEGIYKEEVFPTEYIKISEGCNNYCSYCIIPKLRGKNRSRKIKDIKKEVEYLVQNGTREIILIAQNTTDYGIDLYGESRLDQLLEELSTIKDLKWIRVLYLYPDNFNLSLIEVFKNNPKVLPYVDIPLQHVSDNVLSRMNRHTDKEAIIKLIAKLRTEIPDIVIRTTFIVGFPGEKEEDFEELLEFVKTQKLDKVGVFTYSKEEGTRAYDMDDQVDEQIKEERLATIMEVQKSISEEILEANIGKVFDSIVEEVHSDFGVCRSFRDTPEIDGVIYINGDYDLEIGQFIQTQIIDVMEYDMIGELYELESTK